LAALDLSKKVSPDYEPAVEALGILMGLAAVSEWWLPGEGLVRFSVTSALASSSNGVFNYQ